MAMAKDNCCPWDLELLEPLSQFVQNNSRFRIWEVKKGGEPLLSPREGEGVEPYSEQHRTEAGKNADEWLEKVKKWPEDTP